MGTLTHTSGTINIPDDLAWPDEFAWQAVAAKTTYSITGALLVETGLKLAGRPITLQSDEGTAWLSRADVAALKTLSELAGAAIVLSFRGQTFNVMFNQEASPMDAKPVFDFSDPQNDDFYTVVLRFITV